MTIRDQAIRILSVCASSGGAYCTDDAAYELGFSHAAQQLAFKAFWETPGVFRRQYDFVYAYAEAECMLREGWCPRG